MFENVCYKWHVFETDISLKGHNMFDDIHNMRSWSYSIFFLFQYTVSIHIYITASL